MGLTSTDRARTLQRLHARIRACTKCVAAGYLERARPVVAGSIRDRIAIVGQAPGAVELTTGQPFSGRSGAELRRWLAQAGIDEDTCRTAPRSPSAFRESPRPVAATDDPRRPRSRSADHGSIRSSRFC